MSSKKAIEEFWEKRSLKFGSNIVGVLIKSVPEVVNLYLHYWMLEKIETIIPENCKIKILDLGCGYGRLSNPLLIKFPKVTVFGIDLSQTYVDIYNQNLNPRGKAYKGDILKLPFNGNCFNIVFIVTTLMYLLSVEDQQKAIEEIFRVLKPGGKFAIIERSPLGYSIFTLGGIVNKVRGKTHSEIPAVSFNPNFLGRMIKKAGGEIENFQGIPSFTIFFPLIMIFSKINPNLGRMLLGIIKYVDKSFGKIYMPSLYISYVGKKND